MVVTEWIDGAQDERCRQRTEEGSPQGLQGEVVADLVYRDYVSCTHHQSTGRL